MKTLFFTYLVLVASFLTSTAIAQKHEVGASLGAMNYTGDLSPDYSFYNYRPAFSGFYKHNFNPAIGLKIGLMQGRFRVNDKLSKDPMPLYRDTESITSIVEFFAIAEYNFLDFRKNNDRRKFTPYLSGGISYYVFSQKAPDFGQTLSNGTGAAIPFGLGLRYKASKKINLGFEFIARKTFTDNLDGLSNRLVNGKQVGDRHGDDWYYYTGFILSYTFYGVDCPAIFK
jgi:hypothetical protein